MPDIEHVYEEQWRVNAEDEPIDPDAFRPDIAKRFDEGTLIQIDPSQDGRVSGLTLTINMDAAPLRRFIVDENIKDTWKETVERQYELSVIFYSISQYRELTEKYGESFEESELLTTEIISHSINGIGQTLMPTIIPDTFLERISD